MLIFAPGLRKIMQTYPSGNLAQTLLVPHRRGPGSDVLLPSRLPVEQFP